MKKLLVLLCLLDFAGTSRAQQTVPPHSACDFAGKLIGAWTVENFLSDLSGEVLEEEGQAWEITNGDGSELKGKIKMTFFPDGSFSSEVSFDAPQTTYGYWKTSADCRQLIVTVDGKEETLEVFSVEINRLVLAMSDGEKSVKMIFSKIRR